MKKAFILALALAASPGALEAQDVLTTDPSLPTTRVGTRGATFLQVGVGARAQAMSGAFTALANDISALYWNTAGIGNIENFAAGVSQAYLYEDLDIEHTFIGAVLPLGLTRIGLSVNVLSSGDMAWQSTNFPNATFGERTDPIRTQFEWQGTAVGLHLARPITDRLVVGVAGKYVTEGINNAEANYVGVDLGTTFRTGLYGLTIGAALQNLGSSGRFEGNLLNQELNTGGTENQGLGDFVRIIETRRATNDLELPTTFRFSIMADLIGDATAMIAPNPDQSLRVVWDLNDAIDTDIQTALGFEYGLRDLAFLRVGKKWFNEAQIDREFMEGASFGGGLHLPVGALGNLRLDYAYTDMGDLENIQMFNVEIHF